MPGQCWDLGAALHWCLALFPLLYTICCGLQDRLCKMKQGMSKPQRPKYEPTFSSKNLTAFLKICAFANQNYPMLWSPQQTKRCKYQIPHPIGNHEEIFLSGICHMASLKRTGKGIKSVISQISANSVRYQLSADLHGIFLGYGIVLVSSDVLLDVDIYRFSKSLHRVDWLFGPIVATGHLCGTWSFPGYRFSHVTLGWQFFPVKLPANTRKQNKTRRHKK